MQSEAVKHLTDVLSVVVKVGGVDKDVVEVNHNADVKHVSKDAVDKALEGRRGISQALRHNQPFIRPIACVEGGLPLVSFSDASEVIGGAEINLGVDFGTTRGVK